MSDSNVQFKLVQDKAESLKVKIKEVVSALKDKGHIDNKFKTISSALSEAAPNFPAAEFEEVFERSNTLIKAFDSFNKTYVENGYFEVEIQKSVREAERKDYWKLWRDKLVRWAGGIIAAVLLYSALVALSGSVGWIKVPVHDLVTAKFK